MHNSATTRSAFVLAPVGLLGGWLLMRPIGGRVEPGLWWTAAHAVWLLGFLAFVAVGLALRAWLRSSAFGQVAAWTVVVSAVLNAVQLAIDLAVGLWAPSRSAMKDILGVIYDVPGVAPLFYTVGPQLIFVALLVSAVLLAGRQLIAVPVAVAAALGVLLIGASLAVGRNSVVVPLGMTALGVGLIAMARPRQRRLTG